MDRAQAGKNTSIPFKVTSITLDTRKTTTLSDQGPDGAATTTSKRGSMASSLVSSSKNEPNYHGKYIHSKNNMSTVVPEKPFTMQSLQPPGQQSEGPKVSPRKVSPTLKDERKLFVGGLPPDSTCCFPDLF